MPDTESIEHMRRDPVSNPCTSSDLRSDLESSFPACENVRKLPENAPLPNAMGPLSTSVAPESPVLQFSSSDSAQILRLVAPQRFKISLSEARRKALNAVRRANRRRRMESESDPDSCM